MLKKIERKNKLEMERTYSLYLKKISKIFTGKASTKILDNILIKYNNINVNLNKIANITLFNHNTIKISLFDLSLINIVRNAIIKSKLNLSVLIVNKDILVNLPQINGDRRFELIKIIRYESENSRIYIRYIRRNSKAKIKELKKKKTFNLDEIRRVEKKIQETTDIFIRKINVKLMNKEKELNKI